MADQNTPDEGNPTPDESTARLLALGRPLQFLGNPYVVGIASSQVLMDEELEALSGGGVLPAEAVATLEDRLVAAVEEANSSFFRFALGSIDDASEWSHVTVVPGVTAPGLLSGHSTRKLTIVIPLAVSTSTGMCALQVPTFEKETVLRPGVAVMFPSFMSPHFQLAEGEQVVALLAHAYGPAFR